MKTLVNALFLAIAYLRGSIGRTLVMVLGVAVVFFLPCFTYLASEQLDDALVARAEATPVVVGPAGSSFDLTLASLYFRGATVAPLSSGRADALRDLGYGEVVPLYVKHSAGGAPVIGTDVAYFDARGLELSAGRRFALLGEVVAGAGVARAAGLSVGDRLRSDQSNLYNIAGAYPLLLTVVGVLKATGGPDDEVLFSDLLTTWALDGALHGHSAPKPGEVVATQGQNSEASASVFLFDSFDPEHAAGFHMHGDSQAMPLTSVLVFPRDARAHDQLLGDIALEADIVAVRPLEVVRAVLGVVFRVRDALGVYFAVVAASTLLMLGLVVSLGLRLRRAELDLMVNIGASRGTVASMVAAEVGVVLLLAAVVAVFATSLGLALLRAWLLGLGGVG